MPLHGHTLATIVAHKILNCYIEVKRIGTITVKLPINTHTHTIASKMYYYIISSSEHRNKLATSN